ncbi:hypothetical protein [Paenibacillus sp.]|jgi:hypothetical protein|uniref:hypothetical protein n=1 Tax=Paenibacillus sp. TaxID=58172 RepID=UPI00281F430F|nr:hypothetical protein [Paenibacillus sp.]MDR0269988.1 hypothetical protein [Paenibacillus sp.]
MNTGIIRKSWFRTMIFILPLITVILFGLNGGWVRMNAWTSGAAIGCAEVALLLFLLRTVGREPDYASPVPFRIASGIITLMYGIIVLLSVILFGYIFEISGLTYLTMHLIIFAGFAVILILMELIGKHAGSEERKQYDDRNAQKKQVARISSIRSQIQAITEIPNQNDLLQELRKLEETICYSEPTINTALFEVMNLLEQHIALLEDQVKLIQTVTMPKKLELIAEVPPLVRKIHEIVNERNKQSLHLKSKSL